MLSMIAYLWNRGSRSADMVPDYEHRQNWIFIFGEGTENPDPRFPNSELKKFPVYLTIPMPETATVVSNLTHAMLDYAFRKQ